MTVTIPTATGPVEVLGKLDMATTAWECVGGVLYPTVYSGDGIDGNGSVATPLELVVDSDSGVMLSVGADGILVSPPTITTPGTCVQGDVGADWMIRSFSQTLDTLTVGGAPEHTTVMDGDAATGTPATNISGAGTVTVATIQVVIVNPSACRDLNVYLRGDVSMNCTFQTVGVWNAIVNQQIDGGGYVAISTATYGPLGAILTLPTHQTPGSLHTVPAGGSMTIDRQLQMTTAIGSGAGSLINSYAFSMRYIGGTV